MAAGSTFTHVTLLSSIPLAFTNAGQTWRWLSPGGAAMVLPSRSFGLRIGLSLLEKTLSGVLSNTMPTILILAVRASAAITTAVSARPASARPVSTLAIESPEPLEFSSVTSSPRWEK